MHSASQIPSMEAFIKRLLTMNTCSVNAYELFQTTKIFLKPSNTDDTHAYKQKSKITKAKSILERKLSQNFNGEYNNFIGLLCIYIYILNHERSFYHSNLTKNFSKNLTRTLRKSYQLWKKNRETSEQRSSLTSLSTILFVMVTFVQKSEQNVLFSFQKIFSEPLISLFLTMRLPDDEKLLKSYQIILLYIMKKKSVGHSQRKEYQNLLIKSIVAHVGWKNLSESTALILAGFLNRSIKTIKVGELKKELQSVGLMKRLKLWVFQTKDLNKKTMILEIFVKLSSTNPGVKDRSLSLKDFFQIYREFIQKKQIIEDHEFLFIQLIRSVQCYPKNENLNDFLAEIFTSKIIKNETIKLELLKILIPHLQIVSLMRLCSEGLIICLDEIIQEISANKNTEIIDDSALSTKISLSLDLLFIILNKFEGSSFNIFLSLSSRVKWILESMTPEIKGINFSTFYELKLMFREFQNTQNFLY